MYVIGADIGTTGAKASLIDQKGNTIASAYQGYPLIKPGRGFVEQNAEDWWKAFVYTVRECTLNVHDKSNIIAVSISSQGGTLVPVDSGGGPLSNAMVWMDSRGLRQREELLRLHDEEFYYRKTGWKLSVGLNPVKLKWIRENTPDVFQRCFKFLTTADYINYRLTGEYAIDPSNGAMTQLMDIGSCKWDKEILGLLELEEEKLPGIYESGTVIGNITANAAAELNLPVSVKVINGGHDQYCAALGSGAVENGDMLLSTGTAWVVLNITDKPVFDSETFVVPGRHVVRGMWGALASVPTAGVSMEWFRENFASRTTEGLKYTIESLKAVDKYAEELKEKCEGLFFYPHFNGSGFPWWDSNVKASILGLGLEHGRYDLARTIMEGVAFDVKSIIEEYKKNGCLVENLRIVGGASKSRLWTDLIAAVVDCSILKFEEANVACTGAAIIAGVGCGMFEDYSSAVKSLARCEIYQGRTGSEKEFYERKFEKYQKGRKLLKEFYNVIRS